MIEKFLENSHDLSERLGFCCTDSLNDENQNQFRSFNEYYEESSNNNQLFDSFNSNLEYKAKKFFDDDINKLNEGISLLPNRETRPTEIIFEILKTKNKKKKIFTTEELPKEKKFLKQKRSRTNKNNNNGKKKHTKYDFDNIASKIRTNLFNGILVLLNKSLEDKDSIREKKFYTSQSFGEVDTYTRDKSFYKIKIGDYGKTVQKNLDLLKMPLRQIFYQDCSEKYKNYLNNNKNLLSEISDNSTFNKTNKILDMTFLQCLEHFRGSKKYEVLNGLEKEYQSLIKVFEKKHEEKTYIEKFNNYLKSFEEMFQSRKSYKSSKSKK